MPAQIDKDALIARLYAQFSDDGSIGIEGVYDSSNNLIGVINPKNGATVLFGAGGGIPVTTSNANLSITTDVTGVAWTLFASQACTSLEIDNQTGAIIEYQRNGAGTGMQITPGSTRTIVGITNANQIGIRRVDQGTTQLTFGVSALTGGTVYATPTITSVTLDGGGTYRIFPNIACTSLDIVNATGAELDYRFNGAGATRKIMPWQSFLIEGITNANQVGMRRSDSFSLTPPEVVYAEAIP